MLKLALDATALKAFSMNPPSRRLYRKVDNPYGECEHLTFDDIDIRIGGDLLVAPCRKPAAPRPSDRRLDYTHVIEPTGAITPSRRPGVLSHLQARGCFQPPDRRLRPPVALRGAMLQSSADQRVAETVRPRRTLSGATDRRAVPPFSQKRPGVYDPHSGSAQARLTRPARR